MTDTYPCKHHAVYRAPDEALWTCSICGAEFFHFDMTAQKITIAEPYATLRDQFAMAAMQADAIQSAIIAAAYIAQGKRLAGDVPTLSTTVKEHYETADAMLEARKQ